MTGIEDAAQFLVILHEAVGLVDLSGQGGFLRLRIQNVLTSRLASAAVRCPVPFWPMLSWKRRIAARVSGPKIPSMGPS